jgi:hypothetical protein
MSLVLPKKEESNFETTPAGVYTAVCYRVIDLGTQLEGFGDEEKKSKHKIMISWELHGEHYMQDGRPFSVHKKYTFSSNEKSSLRKHLEAWRGMAFTDEDFGKFDIGVLIGKACMMQMVHNISEKDGNTYANISSIMKLPKGMATPDMVNESIYFSLNEFDEIKLAKLSDQLKQTIMKSPEFAEATKPASAKTEQYAKEQMDF